MKFQYVPYLPTYLSIHLGSLKLQGVLLEIRFLMAVAKKVHKAKMRLRGGSLFDKL